MTRPQPSDPDQPSAEAAIVQTVRRWQLGAARREDVVLALSSVPLDQGEVLISVLDSLQRHVELARVSSGEHVQEDSESWKAELMSARARSWSFPHSVGLLVCPSVIILTDGRRGVALRASGAKALPASTCASLTLLCQTIVMAQNAVDVQELRKLQDQRIASTSTSLSEIEIIR